MGERMVYIRRWSDEKGRAQYGWRVVAVPPEKRGGQIAFYEVENDLADRLEALIERNRIREAKTLMYWFDTDGVVEED